MTSAQADNKTRRKKRKQMITTTGAEEGAELATTEGLPLNLFKYVPLPNKSKREEKAR